MSVFDIRRRFIYIHIPKTAGTSMESIGWVGKGFCKHCGIDYYQNMSKITHHEDVDLSKYFKWSFIRDPYTRFMSGLINHVFKGKYVEGFQEQDEVTKFIIQNANRFNEFEILKEAHLYLTIDNIMVMDFLGKYENLQEDFNKVCDRVGVGRTQLPHILKGRHDDYDHLYTPVTREIVANYYKRDFELFDYEV